MIRKKQQHLFFEVDLNWQPGGHSWTFMLADYNVLKGRIWILIPVWIIVFPYISWLFRKN